MPKSLQSYITDVTSKPRKKPEVVVPEPTPEIVAENKSTSLKDYINTIAEQKVYKAPLVIEQIRLEDEMLINGSLLDPIQDELDRELML